MRNIITNRIIVALLFFWSATFLFSCGDAISETTIDGAAVPTMETDSLDMRYSENGSLSYRVQSPKALMYETKDSTYMVFGKGIDVEMYNDSTREISSTIRGNHAIYNKTKENWIITGNVIGKNLEDDITLYTEELYYNKEMKKIYSNVESKIIDGEEVMVGLNGFKANEDLSDIVFMNSVGRIYLDTTTTVDDEIVVEQDSTKVTTERDSTSVEKQKIEKQDDSLKKKQIEDSAYQK